MDTQAQIDYFEGLLAKHGENYLALDWNSKDSQKLRFEVLEEIFIYGKKAAGISLLDVGCGFGDLFNFLKQTNLLKTHKINYTGLDISAKLLEVAKKKYPEAKFMLADIILEKSVPQFDYIFASGIFNIRTTEAETHLAYVKDMLHRMFDLCKVGLAVNFLSEGALPISNPEEWQSGQYFYFKPDELVNFCRLVCGKYILRHDYHFGDFTLYLLK